MTAEEQLPQGVLEALLETLDPGQHPWVAVKITRRMAGFPEVLADVVSEGFPAEIIIQGGTEAADDLSSLSFGEKTCGELQAVTLRGVPDAALEAQTLEKREGASTIRGLVGIEIPSLAELLELAPVLFGAQSRLEEQLRIVVRTMRSLSKISQRRRSGISGDEYELRDARPLEMA